MRIRLLVYCLLTSVIGAMPILAQTPPPAHKAAGTKAEDGKTFVVDFTQAITGLDGKPFTNPDYKPDPVNPKPAPELTLGDVAVNALEMPLAEDRNASMETKFKNDLIARKIYKNAHAELTAPEMTIIEQRIGNAYGSLVVGAALRILDPTRVKELSGN